MAKSAFQNCSSHRWNLFEQPLYPPFWNPFILPAPALIPILSKLYPENRKRIVLILLKGAFTSILTGNNANQKKRDRYKKHLTLLMVSCIQGQGSAGKGIRWEDFLEKEKWILHQVPRTLLGCIIGANRSRENWQAAGNTCKGLALLPSVWCRTTPFSV